MRVRDAVRAFTRLLGMYVIVAGACQVVIGVLVIWAGMLWKLDALSTLGFYLLVLNAGFIVIGPLAIALSGPLARFAAKYAKDDA